MKEIQEFLNKYFPTEGLERDIAELELKIISRKSSMKGREEQYESTMGILNNK